MSQTVMADGRIICIAGEHEDYYDTDFCIYNDVIVLRPEPGESKVTLESGQVEIYGYPAKVFPPTDFHSATLVHKSIYIIGRLGYPESRDSARTPVYVLDSSTYRIDEVRCVGQPPGCIYEHHASYDGASHSITVRGGKLYVPQAEDETPNYSAHRLHLADHRWEQLAERETHRSFVIRCKDFDRDTYRDHVPATFITTQVPSTFFIREIELYTSYYLDVLGVRVAIDCWITEIKVLFGGNLPADLIHQLLDELTTNLHRDTHQPWSWTEQDSTQIDERAKASPVTAAKTSFAPRFYAAR